jgi:cysteine desulfurase
MALICGVSIADMYLFCTVCHILLMNERVYIDWAAATPLLPEAKAAMLPWLTEHFGNPSAIHQEGQQARDAVETARQQVARALQVKPEFVTWTSGGTEGNNLAIFGTIAALEKAGRAPSDMAVITTAIEHPSVGLAMAWLQERGVEVRYVQVKETGEIDINHLIELLDKKVVLLSTALINSEIGTVQPVRAIRKTLTAAEQQFDTTIALHLDAAQAPLWHNCQFDSLGADLVTLDAAKCCGPKGIGVLVRSRSAQLAPTIFGGGQERGLRPGTENVAGIVGAAVAIEWAQGNWRERSETVRAVRDQAVAAVLQEIPSVLLNGAPLDSTARVANNINISLPGFDTEFLTVVLDTAGFAVSTKSACSGAGGGASSVVMETTGDRARASATLRITLGPETTLQLLQQMVATLLQHLKK